LQIANPKEVTATTMRTLTTTTLKKRKRTLKTPDADEYDVPTEEPSKVRNSRKYKPPQRSFLAKQLKAVHSSMLPVKAVAWCPSA